MPKASSKDIRQWKLRILEQQDSGLSIPAWCCENQVPLYKFRYWYKKLFPQVLDQSAFIEIDETGSHDIRVGFFLECQGIKIHLQPEFDLQALEKCLGVIKKC